MKTAINSNICAAVAILNNYNWFNVAVETPNGEKTTFSATGINFNHGALEFSRLFATPIYTHDNIIEVVATAKNKFSFLTDTGILYIVEGQRNTTLADRQTGSIDTPESLIDWNRSHIDDGGKVFIVLDFGRAGILKRQQEFAIRNYINIFLGGLSRSKQVCRTIYIKAVDQQITVGIYNLESEQPVTAINMLETSFTPAEAAQFNRLIEAAIDGLEIVPQF